MQTSTSPAPPRAAPIAASRGAPVKSFDPATTTTLPKVPLCPVVGSIGEHEVLGRHPAARGAGPRRG